MSNSEASRLPFGKILERIATEPAEAFDEARQRELANAAQQRKIARNEAWRALFEARGVRYRDCRLNNFTCEHPGQSDAVRLLKAFCEEIRDRVGRGQNLVLFGPKGTGKDHLAMACARAAMAQFVIVRWLNGMDFFGEIRDAIDTKISEREVLGKYQQAPVLWISDPLPPDGALKDHQLSMLFRLLDRRYSQKLPVWVTVNVAGPSELEARLGAQNADRLRDGALAIKCNWPSYRKAGT